MKYLLLIGSNIVAAFGTCYMLRDSPPHWQLLVANVAMLTNTVVCWVIESYGKEGQ